MTAACSPSGCARRATSALSAAAPSTTATRRPSHATYMGSMPRSSEAPRTSARTGMSFSLTSTPTLAALAISFRIVATPPRADPGGRGQQAGDEPAQRRGVGGHVGLDVQLTAGQHDRDPVVADRAGHDDRVPGPGVRHAEVQVMLDG